MDEKEITITPETQAEEKQVLEVEVKPEPVEEPKTDLPEGCVKAY